MPVLGTVAFPGAAAVPPDTQLSLLTTGLWNGESAFCCGTVGSCNPAAMHLPVNAGLTCANRAGLPQPPPPQVLDFGVSPGVCMSLCMSVCFSVPWWRMRVTLASPLMFPGLSSATTVTRMGKEKPQTRTAFQEAGRAGWASGLWNVKVDSLAQLAGSFLLCHLP